MSQRASMAVAAAVLLISILAASSTGVSMSWFSDTESTDVDVTTGTASFFISGATESGGVHTLSEGDHALIVTGWTVKLLIQVSDDSSLSLGSESITSGVREFRVGEHTLTSTGTVTLTLVPPE